MAGDRDDNVYQAKLAEQAERYDGKSIFVIGTYLLSFYCLFIMLLCFAQLDDDS